MKKQLKEFLSPVKGGIWDGYSFKDHLLQLENGGLLILFIGITLFIGVAPDLFAYHEMHWKWILLAGSTSILSLIAYQVIKHWKRLKSLGE